MMLKRTPRVNKIICEKVNGEPRLNRREDFALVPFTCSLHHRNGRIKAFQSAEAHESTD